VEDGMAEKMESLHELLVKELSDIHDAENQVMKALPKMAQAASSPELQQAFKRHLEETKGQLNRLQQVFEHLGEEPEGKKCKGMQGLIDEGSEILKMKGDEATRDAALIAAAQKVEHYEIATYGTLCAWAEQIGNNEALGLLKETLAEEENTDKLLTQISETVNQQANANA
jgi:ferritin-like metal-binding protein YciE